MVCKLLTQNRKYMRFLFYFFTNFDKKSSKKMSNVQERGYFGLDKIALYEYNKATI